MAVTFGYEYFKSQPNELAVVEGLAVPYCSDCSGSTLMQAVGIIGAIIMPHNLYLHSALVKSRRVNRHKKKEVRDANRYVFIESAIALSVSLVINIAVTAVFAHGLYNKKNSDVYESCIGANITQSDIFTNDNSTFDANLYTAGVFLGCEFGIEAMYIWAIGIFAAGQVLTLIAFHLILVNNNKDIKLLFIVINNDWHLFGSVRYGRLPRPALAALETSSAHENHSHNSNAFDYLFSKSR